MEKLNIIVVESVRPDSSEALDLIQALDEELHQRYPGAAIEGLLPEDTTDRLIFVVARTADGAVACGAVREIESGVGEIKRMFVRPAHRGQGIARAILAALEQKAAARGLLVLRIETGDRQPEAITLYLSAGYRAVPPFGKYIGNPYSRCFEKRLT